MKNLKTLLLILLIPTWISAQTDVYLFAYFTQNGQDGLHFAYSYDGLKWDSLNKEALRVLGLLTKWEAGKLDGEKVRGIYMIPIKFKLER